MDINKEINGVELNEDMLEKVVGGANKPQNTGVDKEGAVRRTKEEVMAYRKASTGGTKMSGNGFIKA